MFNLNKMICKSVISKSIEHSTYKKQNCYNLASLIQKLQQKNNLWNKNLKGNQAFVPEGDLATLKVLFYMLHMFYGSNKIIALYKYWQSLFCLVNIRWNKYNYVKCPVSPVPLNFDTVASKWVIKMYTHMHVKTEGISVWWSLNCQGDIWHHLGFCLVQGLTQDSG